MEGSMARNLIFAMAAGLVIGIGASAATPLYPQTASLGVMPTAAEANTIRNVLSRFFGKEWSDYEKTKGGPISFTVGHADLDGDGRADLLVYLSDNGFGYCGSGGCSGYAILVTSQGYASKPIDLANSGGMVTVLPQVHKGMHDLRFDDSRYVYKWDGSQYQ
jgi:hypothetical protein